MVGANVLEGGLYNFEPESVLRRLLAKIRRSTLRKLFKIPHVRICVFGCIRHLLVRGPDAIVKCLKLILRTCDWFVCDIDCNLQIEYVLVQDIIVEFVDAVRLLRTVIIENPDVVNQCQELVSLDFLVQLHTPPSVLTIAIKLQACFWHQPWTSLSHPEHFPPTSLLQSLWIVENVDAVLDTFDEIHCRCVGCLRHFLIAGSDANVQNASISTFSSVIVSSEHRSPSSNLTCPAARLSSCHRSCQSPPHSIHSLRHP